MSTTQYESRADYAAHALPAQAGLIHRVKPVVRAQYVEQPEIGDSCNIIPIDHPASYLNGDIAHTSEVVAITEDGFETLNTRYVLEA
jgi:hypothetical protein